MRKLVNYRHLAFERINAPFIKRLLKFNLNKLINFILAGGRRKIILYNLKGLSVSHGIVLKLRGHAI